MPNNIANRVEVDSRFEEIEKFMTGEDGRAFDFNKIVPMPKSLDIVCDGYAYDNPTSMFHSSADSNIASIRKLFEANNEKLGEEALKSFTQSMENYVRCGYCTWYDWSIAVWGTKWNSYECDKGWKDGVVTFSTAWGGIPELIKLLSLKFPDVTFTYSYASENSGYSTGEYIIKDGEELKKNLPVGGSHEAYEMYVTLHPDDTSIKLVDGKYWYINEEYPEEKQQLED